MNTLRIVLHVSDSDFLSFEDESHMKIHSATPGEHRILMGLCQWI